VSGPAERKTAHHHDKGKTELPTTQLGAARPASGIASAHRSSETLKVRRGLHGASSTGHEIADNSTPGAWLRGHSTCPGVLTNSELDSATAALIERRQHLIKQPELGTAKTKPARVGSRPPLDLPPAIGREVLAAGKPNFLRITTVRGLTPDHEGPLETRRFSRQFKSSFTPGRDRSGGSGNIFTQRANVAPCQVISLWARVARPQRIRKRTRLAAPFAPVS